MGHGEGVGLKKNAGVMGEIDGNICLFVQSQARECSWQQFVREKILGKKPLLTGINK